MSGVHAGAATIVIRTLLAPHAHRTHMHNTFTHIVLDRNARTDDSRYLVPSAPVLYYATNISSSTRDTRSGKVICMSTVFTSILNDVTR